ncbi:MAG TPA: VOC family protein [Steroidobacteraceae bacterium]|nr:VOC family protein [Steroidobacteraceae bacterium]
MHFEIHGQDQRRLHEFYQQVFGWSIDADNPVGYGMVDTNTPGAGISGGIMAGLGTRGVLVYVQTEDVRATLDTAVAHGAEVVMAPVTLPDGSRDLAQFRDPDGNWVGLIHPRP